MASKKNSSTATASTAKQSAWTTVVKPQTTSKKSQSPVASSSPSTSSSSFKSSTTPEYSPINAFDSAKARAFLKDRVKDALSEIPKKNHYKNSSNSWNSVINTKKGAAGSNGGHKKAIEGVDVLQELNRVH